MYWPIGMVPRGIVAMLRDDVVHIEDNVGRGAIWRLSRVLGGRSVSAVLSVEPEGKCKGNENGEEGELLDKEWPSRKVFSMRPPARQVLLRAIQ